MDRGDAVLVGIDERHRIDTAPDHPGDIDLPGQAGAALEEAVMGQRAVGKRLELEIVVVPAEVEASVPEGFARLFEPGAEGRPAGGVGRAVVRHDIGAINRVHAQRPRRVQHPVGLLLQLVEAEMAGRHPHAGSVQFTLQRREAGLVEIAIDAPETLDLLVAERADQRDQAGKRRKVAAAIELEGNIRHLSVLSVGRGRPPRLLVNPPPGRNGGRGS